MQPSALWRWAMRDPAPVATMPSGAVVAPDKPLLPASR